MDITLKVSKGNAALIITALQNLKDGMKEFYYGAVQETMHAKSGDEWYQNNSSPGMCEQMMLAFPEIRKASEFRDINRERLEERVATLTATVMVQSRLPATFSDSDLESILEQGVVNEEMCWAHYNVER